MKHRKTKPQQVACLSVMPLIGCKAASPPANDEHQQPVHPLINSFTIVPYVLQKNLRKNSKFGHEELKIRLLTTLCSGLAAAAEPGRKLAYGATTQSPSGVFPDLYDLLSIDSAATRLLAPLFED